MKKAVSFTAFFLALLSFGGIGAACGKAGKTDYPKIDTSSRLKILRNIKRWGSAHPYPP